MILIKGAKMPKNCIVCPCLDKDLQICEVLKRDMDIFEDKLPDCPLVEIPSADVVEVVRCKDCKFWDSDCIWCELWGNTQEYGNGFCSYGEKKEQENED